MDSVLVCKCDDCTHWEVERDSIHDEYHELVCKTCGLSFPIQLKIDDHDHLLHWAEKT
jgi:hypothetical protein